MRIFLILICCVFSLQAKIYEQDASGNIKPADMQWETAASDPYDDLPNQDFKSSLLKMFFSLLGLVALLAFTIWMIRRFVRTKMEMNYKSSTIQILEKRTISPKSILYVVEVEGKKLLISESQFEVRALEKLPKSEDE